MDDPRLTVQPRRIDSKSYDEPAWLSLLYIFTQLLLAGGFVFGMAVFIKRLADGTLP